MDNTELPHLATSLPLASRLSSSFNSNDAQSFQGFSTAITDIDHNLQATSTFQSQLNSHDNVNRYDLAPPSRPTQELSPKTVRQIRQTFNGYGELEWGEASITSSLQNTNNGTEDGSYGSEIAGEVKDSHIGNMKIVPNPPDLDVWRARLFDVDEPITLTEEQFQIYFPHVDNVYSHRSTQKYKRKPFVSHYWDCRLKGRPSGTPKSDDPNKKKRKRVARERDLCDVKIKITEYFPGAVTVESPSDLRSSTVDSPSSDSQVANLFFTNRDESNGSQPFGVLTPSPWFLDKDFTRGQRFYTIQRVNGNGGNGKSDGVEGGHRHTLEESDRVKKNSVQRYLLKKAKDEKRVLTQAKGRYKKATGRAHETVKKRSEESNLKLFGVCYCPFVQRIWIALEAKGIPYQYIEIDPYNKPPELVELNPRGMVPTILHGNWSCYESNVLLEYLEDLDEGVPLLPPGDAKLRAHCRLWADHINRFLVPCFYKILMEQDPQKRTKHTDELKEDIAKLVNASHVHGPFFLGPSLSYVDIQFAPWVIRLSRVMKPYRGWCEPELNSRLSKWIQAIEENEHIMATTSNDELYLESYGVYSDDRPKNQPANDR